MKLKGNSIFKGARFIKQKLLFVMLAGALPALAQLNPGNLTQYTELDGLPASEVGSILQDRNGYIWIGTINGLARFDGYEFKRFFNNPNDPGTIEGLQVAAMYEDRNGKIWVNTAPEHLNVFDQITNGFSQYAYRHLIERPANLELVITAICEDRKNRIYFGISTYRGEPIHSGILYKDNGDPTIHRLVIQDSANAGQNVVSMATDPNGNIWIITYSGLHKIDTLHQWGAVTSLNRELEKSGDYAIDLEFSTDGHLWLISSKSTLYEFDPELNRYQIYRQTGPVTGSFTNNLALDQEKNIWIGTDRGLSKFNRKSKKFEQFDYETNHPMDRAQVLVIKPDDFGNIWIGTLAHGLFRYEEKAIFKSHSYKKEATNSLTPGWANTIYEVKDGRIVILTNGQTAGLNILDPNSGGLSKIPRDIPLPWDGAFSLIEYAQNEFYVGSNPEPYQLSLKNWSIKAMELEGLPKDLIIIKFLEDNKNNLWAGTTKGLYKRPQGKSGFIKYDLSLRDSADASSNEISGFFESEKHGLWLLTNNGLFLYNYETDKIERHGFDRTQGDIFITQDINSFYEDSSGLAWVGTWQGGLSQYDITTKKIVTYTLDDGLPSMSIQSILADEIKGSLWLGTFDGLSRYDVKEKKFYNYSIADGIQGQLFADGAALKTSKGLFIFGGSNGITVFDPDQIKESSEEPRIFLTSFKLFDQRILPGANSILKKPIQETSEIILKSNQNNITLEFAVIHYSNPAKNKAVYRLENYENEWRDAGSQHLAFYPKLPPGQYFFRVKAANNNGVWNEEGASLQIRILPPWWNTSWAYFGYFIALVVGGFAVDRYLRHRIVEKERERFQAKQLEQAKVIEKAYLELGQAHESLKATQAQLIQSEKMASLGELTAGIAHEIQNPLNFVNNFSEINIELLEEIKGQRSKVRGERNEQVENELLNDIKENEEKINHHGRRADAIVKGMLLHSRTSSGNKGDKEPVDINAMVDEYFRLAYHGLRAKDKSFNAALESDYDPTLGNVHLVPQDIGRVILNLITNAFYAVNKKNLDQETAAVSSRLAETDLEAAQPGSASNSYQSIRSGYEPVVKVSTKKFNNHVEIRVKDNGTGIPKKNLEKIFQPFFTTKPVGQGTGLGLSISYDIVKASGGELKVNSIEGEGSEFIMQLPV